VSSYSSSNQASGLSHSRDYNSGTSIN